MKLLFYKYNIHQAHTLRTVLIPAVELKNTYVIKIDEGVFTLFGDKEDLVTLARIFTLASQKKNTLIHLPIRKNTADSYIEKEFGRETQDIVIAHHQLQFPRNDWKEVRQKCKNGQLVSHKVNEQRETPHFKNIYKDTLLIKNQYDTVFMLGNNPLFQMISGDCLRVSEEGPLFPDLGPGYHYHIHLDTYTRNHDDDMSIDFYDSKEYLE